MAIQGNSLGLVSWPRAIRYPAGLLPQIYVLGSSLPGLGQQIFWGPKY